MYGKRLSLTRDGIRGMARSGGGKEGTAKCCFVRRAGCKIDKTTEERDSISATSY